MHEGKILHRLLKDKEMGATEVARRLNVSRRAVYNYYKSENLSNKVKKRFLETLGIDVTKEIHIQLYSRDEDAMEVQDPQGPALKKKTNGNLETQVEDQRRIIDQLEAASVEKDKRIESLENMLKIALKPDGKA